MPILINITDILTWISLSIFVFKMQAVRNKLTSETPEEFRSKENLNNRASKVTIGILVIYIIVSTVIDSIYREDKEKQSSPYIYFDGVFRVTKFIIDVYLYIMFARLYIYFFKLKNDQKKASTSNDQRKIFLSPLNWIIFLWGIFLMLFSFYHSLLSILLAFINDSSIEIIIK